MEPFYQSIILGIVQGITEFLPISSTAHLRIVPAVFHWQDPGTAFSAVIQLGTMFSVIIYFKNDLIKMYGAFYSDLTKYKKLVSNDSKVVFWILLGTIPICVFGIIFKDPIEKGLVRNLNIIAFYLIFFGLMLFISELLAKQKRDIKDINILDILLIGLSQSFALIPGVSRSGVTLFSGLLLGFKRSDAARFSFLLSVPAVLLSGLLELYTSVFSFQSGANDIVILNLAVGILAAFIAGYLSIDFLLKFLVNNKSHIFVLYRVILGAAIIYLNLIGMIH